MSQVASGADHRSAFAHARSEILDVAFHAEVKISEIAAAWLGKGVDEVVYLRDHIISPLSVNQKLKAIDEMMTSRDWLDEFPFVIPVLTKLFEVRNHLAHSLDDGVEAGSDDLTYLRWSWKRGMSRVTRLPLKILTGIAASARRVIRYDLDFLWIRVVPDEYWWEGAEDD